MDQWKFAPAHRGVSAAALAASAWLLFLFAVGCAGAPQTSGSPPASPPPSVASASSPASVAATTPSVAAVPAAPGLSPLAASNATTQPSVATPSSTGAAATAVPRPSAPPDSAAALPAQRAEVSVTTDRTSYARGAPIFVTIHNGLAMPIYAPLGQSYCSLLTVQRLEGTAWVPQGACPAGGASFLIQPNGEIRGALGPARPPSTVQGPSVGGSTAPTVLTEDLRQLPTAVPPRLDEPAREVPQGVLPPSTAPAGIESLPNSTLQRELAPGTYRIQFRFSVGALSAPQQEVISEQFVVGD